MRVSLVRIRLEAQNTPLSMNPEILNTTDILFQSGQIIDKAQCEIYLCEWDNIHGDIVLFV